VTVYLAIDPGGTCGISYAQLARQDPFDPAAVTAMQLNDVECVDWVRAYVTSDWVVFMERFFITVQTAQLSPEGSHKALDVIGTVKNLCRWAGAGFVLQSANDAKKFVTNEQLRTLGLWQPNADHARDAVRHLAYGIVHHAAGKACEDLKSRMA
jgi:hypothetical protein